MEKKKRTHAEVVADREARERIRQEKLEEREALREEREIKAKERAERRAIREELQRARDARRLAREARRNMSDEDKLKEKIAAKKAQTKKKKGIVYANSDSPYYSAETYTKDVQIGDTLQIKFAGRLIWGTLIKIGKAINTDIELRFENITLYTIQTKDGYKYPVRRENIVGKA